MKLRSLSSIYSKPQVAILRQQRAETFWTKELKPARNAGKY